MSIKILNSLKPSQGFEYISDFLKNTDPLDLQNNHVVVVPDRYTLSAEKFIYSGLKGKGSLNINVLFLSRILKHLNIKEKFISSFGAVMLLRRACKSVNLKFYNGSLSHTGFYSALYECICNFTASCITPEDLHISAQKANDELKLRLIDLYEIYKAYLSLTENKYLDSSGAAKLIAKYAYKSDYIKNSNFYIAGFDDPSKAELNCFAEIAKHCKNIIFSIGLNINGKNNSNEKLIEIFNNSLLSSKAIDLPNDLSEQDNYLFSNLDSYNKLPYSGNISRNYKIHACGSPNEEAEFVAQQIVKHVENGGKLSEIAVIFADSENIFPAVKAFRDYLIPYHISEKGYLLNSPVFKALISLLKCFTDNLSAEDVLDFIKSGYLDIPVSLCNIFENYCYKYGIDRTNFLKPFELSDDTDDIVSAEFVRRSFESAYRLIQEKQHDAAEAATTAINLITSSSAYELYSNALQAENLYAFSSAHTQAADKINELILQLGEMTDNEIFSLKDYLNYLITGAEAIKLSTIPASVDTVLCGDTESYRYVTGLKKIFIINACEGIFPKSTQSFGLLSRSDLKEIPLLSPEQQNIDYLKLISSRFKAKLLFLADVKEMIFTYTAVDNTLSEYVNGLKSIFDIKCGSGLDYRLKQKDVNIVYPLNTILSPDKIFIRSGYSSISALESYFSCPKRHFFNYGLNLKPREKAQMQGLDRGSFLHLAIEYFVRDYQKGADILKLANASFDKALDDPKFNRYLNSSSGKTMFEKLKLEVLRTCNALGLLADKSAFITEKKYLEASFKNGGDLPPLTIDIGDRQINLGGKIDRIDFFENTDGKVYARIIDYKSGKSDYAEKELYFGNKIQLFIYMTVLKNCGYESGGLYYFPVHDSYKTSGSYAYSLSGVTPLNDDVLSACDADYNGSESVITGFSVKYDKENNKKENKNLLAPSTLAKYLAYSSEVCKQALTEILGGNITASPAIKCDLCDYNGLCGFELDNITLRPQSLGQKSKEYITGAIDGNFSGEENECTN